jgi:hypothetical protein
VIGGVIQEQQREHKQAARGDGKDLMSEAGVLCVLGSHLDCGAHNAYMVAANLQVLGHAVMLCTFGTIMETRIVPTLLDRSKEEEK